MSSSHVSMFTVSLLSNQKLYHTQRKKAALLTAKLTHLTACSVTLFTFEARAV